MTKKFLLKTATLSLGLSVSSLYSSSATQVLLQHCDPIGEEDSLTTIASKGMRLSQTENKDVRSVGPLSQTVYCSYLPGVEAARLDLLDLKDKVRASDHLLYPDTFEHYEQASKKHIKDAFKTPHLNQLNGSTHTELVTDLSVKLFRASQNDLSKSRANDEWIRDDTLGALITFTRNEDEKVSILIEDLGVLVPLFKNHRILNMERPLDSLTPYGASLTSHQKITAQFMSRLIIEMPPSAFKKGLSYRLKNPMAAMEDLWNFMTGANMVHIYPRSASLQNDQQYVENYFYPLLMKAAYNEKEGVTNYSVHERYENEKSNLFDILARNIRAYNMEKDDWSNNDASKPQTLEEVFERYKQLALRRNMISLSDSAVEALVKIWGRWKPKTFKDSAFPMAEYYRSFFDVVKKENEQKYLDQHFYTLLMKAAYKEKEEDFNYSLHETYEKERGNLFDVLARNINTYNADKNDWSNLGGSKPQTMEEVFEKYRRFALNRKLISPSDSGVETLIKIWGRWKPKTFNVKDFPMEQYRQSLQELEKRQKEKLGSFLNASPLRLERSIQVHPLSLMDEDSLSLSPITTYSYMEPAVQVNPNSLNGGGNLLNILERMSQPDHSGGKKSHITTSRINNISVDSSLAISEYVVDSSDSLDISEYVDASKDFIHKSVQAKADLTNKSMQVSNSLSQNSFEILGKSQSSNNEDKSSSFEKI